MTIQLENLVQNWTADLRAANQSRRAEIGERIQLEQQLSRSRDRLRALSRRAGGGAGAGTAADRPGAS